MTIKKVMVFVTCFLFVPMFTRAQTDHSLKLLFHGAKNTGDSIGFRAAGWLVAPDIVNAPDKWLMVAGPRYNGLGWWVEAMGGFIMQRTERTSLIDIRAKFPDIGPVTPWTNVELIGLTKKEARSYYVYFHLECPIPWDIGRFGLETENVFKEVGDDVISFGPHLAVSFGKTAFVVAYQFQKKANNRMYLRMVMDL